MSLFSIPLSIRSLFAACTFSIALSAIFAPQIEAQNKFDYTKPADSANPADYAKAANAFLSSLPAESLERAQLAYDSELRTKWHYLPFKDRRGVSLMSMTPAQRAKAIALFKTVLSEQGFTTLSKCMALEAILNDIENAPDLRNPLKYYWTIFGKPAATGTWGLGVEGHHLSSNFVIRDNQLVCATPLFIGANPAIVETLGKNRLGKGTRILAAEEDLGLELFAALKKKQQKVARVAATSPRDMREGFKRQLQAKAAGLPAQDMDKAQRALLMKVVEQYLNHLPADLASRFKKNIEKAGVERIQFAFAGEGALDKAHSYHVIGPTFAILFYNTQKGAGGTPVNHAHTVLRTNGRDFFLMD